MTRGKGRGVELEDAGGSDRVVNSALPILQQPGNTKQTGLVNRYMGGYQRGTHLTLCSGRWLGTTLRWLRVLFLFLLLFLVFLLLARLDGIATGFDPIHNPPNRHRVLACVISTRRNTLLDHGENILASGYVSGIVRPFRCLSRGPVESGDAKSGRCESEGNALRVSLWSGDGFKKTRSIPLKLLRRSVSAFARFEFGSELARVLRLRAASMSIGRQWWSESKRVQVRSRDGERTPRG